MPNVQETRHRAGTALRTEQPLPIAWLKVTEDGLALIDAAHASGTVPVGCIERSKLLHEVLEHAETAGESSIPVSTAAFLAWLQYVQPDCSSSISLQPPTPTRASPLNFTDRGESGHQTLGKDPEMQDLCELLQVRNFFCLFLSISMLKVAQVVDTEAC